LGILKRIIAGNRQKTRPARIEVITTASMIPEEVGPVYAGSFANAQLPESGHYGHSHGVDAQRRHHKRLMAADVVMFSRRQPVAAAQLSDTEFLKRMMERYYASHAFRDYRHQRGRHGHVAAHDSRGLGARCR
jgi:cyanophycinase